MKAVSLPSESLPLRLPRFKTTRLNFLNYHNSHKHYLHEDASSTSFSPLYSGIPRPSLQASRPSISDSRPTTPTKSGSPFRRTRTLSQPKLMELDITAPSRLDARATSPNTPRPSNVKPTRIPVPRTCTPSSSGYAQILDVERSESHNSGRSSHRSLQPDAPLGSVVQQQPHPEYTVPQSMARPRVRGVQRTAV